MLKEVLKLCAAHFRGIRMQRAVKSGRNKDEEAAWLYSDLGL